MWSSTHPNNAENLEWFLPEESFKQTNVGEKGRGRLCVKSKTGLLVLKFIKLWINLLSAQVRIRHKNLKTIVHCKSGVIPKQANKISNSKLETHFFDPKLSAQWSLNY